ncbi:hypothetical protein BD410DRAFT_735374, partial [Rickenella mellea]
ATVDRPKTAFTFAVLDRFIHLTTQSKINIYDFYMSLVHETDNTGTLTLKYRYKELTRVIRQYGHLLMAKRSGRGHDPTGILGTKPGEFAVECPACPQPGRNLPIDWENAPPNERWKYGLYLAIDANFRLKLKQRGIKDSPLGDGLAYFVPKTQYDQHLAEYVDQPEMNTCNSNLSAVDHANTRGSKKMAVTGVGGVNCARHVINRKIAFGDLQKGERYCNMDFVVLSTLEGTESKVLFLSYDIMCQWHKNLPKRMEEYPVHRQLDTGEKWIIFAIPKFHLLAHGNSCQSKFNYNYKPGAARTCGESIEQTWSGQNGVSMSTREMSPGSRQDTLDSHLGAWNHRKVTGLGKYLLSLLRDALPMRDDHRDILDELNASLEPELISNWEKMVAAWNLDHAQPDPYEDSASNDTGLADVRVELAQEEAADAAAGNFAPNEATASVFLSTGFDLEDQQRVLRVALAASKSSPSALQTAEIAQKRNALQHRIHMWRRLQDMYMPGLSLIRSGTVRREGEAETDFPESEPLCLPSGLTKAQMAVCVAGLAEKERRLCIGQAEDSLRSLRNQLRIKAGLQVYKRTFVTGQKASTRARTLLARFDAKIKRCAERYRAARSALEVLEPGGIWLKRFRVLNEADIRGPGRDNEEQDPKSRQRAATAPGWVGEGRQIPSWIWRVARPAVDTGEGMEHVMRVEWAKAKARAERWDEEVVLVIEEMRRTLAFLTWRATWWEAQCSRRTGLSVALSSGICAYGIKQAAIQRCLALRFSQLWLPFLAAKGLSQSWCSSAGTPADLNVRHHADLGRRFIVPGYDDDEEEDDGCEADSDDDGAGSDDESEGE